MHNPRSVWSILRCPLVSLALAIRGGPSRSWHISNVKLLVRGSDFATIQAQFHQMPVLTCNSAARTAGSPRRKAAKEREDGRVTCRADRLQHQGGGPLRVDGTEIQPYSAADKTSDPISPMRFTQRWPETSLVWLAQLSSGRAKRVQWEFGRGTQASQEVASRLRAACRRWNT